MLQFQPKSPLYIQVNGLKLKANITASLESLHKGKSRINLKLGLDPKLQDKRKAAKCYLIFKRFYYLKIQLTRLMVGQHSSNGYCKSQSESPSPDIKPMRVCDITQTNALDFHKCFDFAIFHCRSRKQH